MRISNIKLAGFKSFVDPTTLHLANNLTGIVGPNGCGKSNIIDAVLWVMGEISAKHLRGDSMADVIFNGSSTRRPVGQAMVEVVFDNSTHSFGGPYASYSEVSLKRLLSRDGTSVYFLNGARCRRRDIRDLFLGTGVGTRSYAVIEQGMISRIVEAKPEELRAFLEEAAGVSRYRERRRETEIRLQQARDNLSRLDDVRAEVDTQLSRVQQQARAAERYRRLKQAERRVKAELLALAWRELEREAEAHAKVTEGRLLATEAVMAKLRECELHIEHLREQHGIATDRFSEIQARYYTAGAEISRLEQAIQHARDRQRSLEEESARIAEELAGAGRAAQADESELGRLRGFLAGEKEAEGRALQEEQLAAEQLAACEAEMQACQEQWEGIGHKVTGLSRTETAELIRIEHLAQRLAASAEGIERAEASYHQCAACDSASTLTELGDRLAQLRAAYEQLQAHRTELQAKALERGGQRDRAEARLQEIQERLRTLVGRRTSLETLQEHAGGGDLSTASNWIASLGALDPMRVIHGLAVEPGFEKAVEAVLGPMLNAFFVDNITAFLDHVCDFSQGVLALIERNAPARETVSRAFPLPLSSKLIGPNPLGALLHGVYAVASLDEARAVLPQLLPGESVVTASGVWLGPGWLRYQQAAEDESGVLQRQKEIEALYAEGAALEQGLAEAASRLGGWRSDLLELEQEDRSLEAEGSRLREKVAEAQSALAAREAEQGQLRARQEMLSAELERLRGRTANDRTEIEAARGRLGAVQAELEALGAQRSQLLERRDLLARQLEATREAWRGASGRAHGVALRMEGARAQCAFLEDALRRGRDRIEALAARRLALDAARGEGDAPIVELQAALELALGAHVRAEEELGEARARLAEMDAGVREQEQQRLVREQATASLRDELEQSRLQQESVRVRLEAQRQLIEETGFILDEVLGVLPAEAESSAWQERLQAVEQKVLRLGPINLAAIDEVESLNARKSYLDRQHADLSEALATLEDAIRRIDRETRERFKDTFERVDAGLRAMFPRLFGGGHAHLALCGEDLLGSGVTLMAQPPGKRNSTIHLLSGGEKALTALALVFTIFELNPAPFCLLDEVDAPLDDANVGHLGAMLQSMSATVQFLCVTHNKITMEIADRLIGVTMQEAGVSRLVAVDIDEAVRLAATA